MTIAIVVLWVITAVVRIWVPWPVASVLDSALPCVVGYWFVSNAQKNGNGNDKAAA